MRNLLCVGGSHAGEIVRVDDSVDFVALHERVDLTPRDYGQIMDRVSVPQGASPTGERCQYRVERLQQGNKTYEVLYIRDGQDLIGDLINGYRPTVGKRFTV